MSTEPTRLYTNQTESVAEALQARVQELEEEIDRLTRLAASAKEFEVRKRYWELAGDMQREARKLHNEFQKLVMPTDGS
jgi:hypothetical protein